MSNEYMQHSQCQTCFVDYSINHESMQNIDTYRSEERLLVARLERCRLLLACIGYADDRIRDSEDDNPEPIARLQCPDLLCKRLEKYTTRSNLMFGVMKCAPSVRKYLHELIDLLIHSNARVTEELNGLLSPLSQLKRPAQGKIGIGAQEIFNMRYANTSRQTLFSVAGSLASEGGLISLSEPLKVKAASNIDDPFVEAVIRPTTYTFQPEKSTDMLANDSRWTSTESAPLMPSDEIQWLPRKRPLRCLRATLGGHPMSQRC
ncbi:uncharacterized protein RCO7_07686 [Rhynchosporium graminicola]|uniref:Uncharacterized protein n=1 Tax=Rhynchosporium graminicola TaxID=2792576 RepID=A0A1E1LPV2_9HELO|nr:uncharacterized protein RCO7_07686 [Rhynchosporium commune]